MKMNIAQIFQARNHGNARILTGVTFLNMTWYCARLLSNILLSRKTAKGFFHRMTTFNFRKDFPELNITLRKGLKTIP